jgi:hypothetical protein
LLPQEQVLEENRAPPTEQPDECATKEPDDTHHAPLLSRFAIGWQSGILLEVQADGVMAKDTSRSDLSWGGANASWHCQGHPHIAEMATTDDGKRRH